MSQAASQTLLSAEEFTQRLRAVGEEGYHDKHPFHILMHEGKLSQRQLQAWIENRFYYQAIIPKKDAAIMAKVDDPAVRRAWIQRIIDHDGTREHEGGIHKWLVLAEAAGLRREDVENFRFVLPGVRFAVDAYLTFVQSHSLLEAVASSLTELFAPTLMSRRLPAFEEHYPWVQKTGLEYFRSRLIQAPRDVEYGLDYVITHCTTRELQERAVAVLTLKCHILWSLLDAVYFAYVSPGWLPPLWGK
ncbi:MAG TPA: pyrroloquinoline-quinone synthase PqqC [Candidatus Binatia bacterium]|jgi:coenzyme PQQ biosynthesis protein C|nr:pyrroloquinoline-quinone synthase PqqC [Candidatus Binatia bacterium]